MDNDTQIKSIYVSRTRIKVNLGHLVNFEILTSAYSLGIRLFGNLISKYKGYVW